MQTIYKYPLEVTDKQSLTLPDGAKILSVQMQGESLCLWAMVSPTIQAIETRTFWIYGTGHDVTLAPEHLNFLATVQMRGGTLIFHVFEEVG